jgi:hypothetical protein
LNKVITNTHYPGLLIITHLLKIQFAEHSNYWLSIALTAYLVGAIMEGVNIVSQLFNSSNQLDKTTPNNPPKLSWQTLVVITSVSICGSVSWPCRLFHRSIRWGVDRVCKLLS